MVIMQIMDRTLIEHYMPTSSYALNGDSCTRMHTACSQSHACE